MACNSFSKSPASVPKTNYPSTQTENNDIGLIPRDLQIKRDQKFSINRAGSPLDSPEDFPLSCTGAQTSGIVPRDLQIKRDLPVNVARGDPTPQGSPELLLRNASDDPSSRCCEGHSCILGVESDSEEFYGGVTVPISDESLPALDWTDFPLYDIGHPRAYTRADPLLLGFTVKDLDRKAEDLFGQKVRRIGYRRGWLYYVSSGPVPNGECITFELQSVRIVTCDDVCETYAFRLWFEATESDCDPRHTPHEVEHFSQAITRINALMLQDAFTFHPPGPVCDISKLWVKRESTGMPIRLISKYKGGCAQRLTNLDFAEPYLDLRNTVALFGECEGKPACIEQRDLAYDEIADAWRPIYHAKRKGCLTPFWRARILEEGGLIAASPMPPIPEEDGSPLVSKKSETFEFDANTLAKMDTLSGSGNLRNDGYVMLNNPRGTRYHHPLERHDAGSHQTNWAQQLVYANYMVTTLLVCASTLAVGWRRNKALAVARVMGFGAVNALSVFLGYTLTLAVVDRIGDTRFPLLSYVPGFCYLRIVPHASHLGPYPTWGEVLDELRPGADLSLGVTKGFVWHVHTYKGFSTVSDVKYLIDSVMDSHVVNQRVGACGDDLVARQVCWRAVLNFCVSVFCCIHMPAGRPLAIAGLLLLIYHFWLLRHRSSCFTPLEAWFCYLILAIIDQPCDGYKAATMVTIFVGLESRMSFLRDGPGFCYTRITGGFASVLLGEWPLAHDVANFVRTDRNYRFEIVTVDGHLHVRESDELRKGNDLRKQLLFAGVDTRIGGEGKPHVTPDFIDAWRVVYPVLFKGFLVLMLVRAWLARRGKPRKLPKDVSVPPVADISECSSESARSSKYGFSIPTWGPAALVFFLQLLVLALLRILIGPRIALLYLLVVVVDVAFSFSDRKLPVIGVFTFGSLGDNKPLFAYISYLKGLGFNVEHKPIVGVARGIKILHLVENGKALQALKYASKGPIVVQKFLDNGTNHIAYAPLGGFGAQGKVVSFDLAPPPRCLKSMRIYGAPTLIGAILNTLVRACTFWFQPDIRIGSFPGCAPRSADGVTFLKQKVHEPTRKGIVTLGSSSLPSPDIKKLESDHPGIVWYASKPTPGFLLDSDSDHEAMFARYDLAYTHGGAGTMATAAAAGCKPLSLSKVLDRDYVEDVAFEFDTSPILFVNAMIRHCSVLQLAQIFILLVMKESIPNLVCFAFACGCHLLRKWCLMLGVIVTKILPLVGTGLAVGFSPTDIVAQYMSTFWAILFGGSGSFIVNAYYSTMSDDERIDAVILLSRIMLDFVSRVLRQPQWSLFLLRAGLLPTLAAMLCWEVIKTRVAPTVRFAFTLIHRAVRCNAKDDRYIRLRWIKMHTRNEYIPVYHAELGHSLKRRVIGITVTRVDAEAQRYCVAYNKPMDDTDLVCEMSTGIPVERWRVLEERIKAFDRRKYGAFRHCQTSIFNAIRLEESAHWAIFVILVSIAFCTALFGLVLSVSAISAFAGLLGFTCSVFPSTIGLDLLFVAGARPRSSHNWFDVGYWLFGDLLAEAKYTTPSRVAGRYVDKSPITFQPSNYWWSNGPRPPYESQTHIVVMDKNDSQERFAMVAGSGGCVLKADYSDMFEVFMRVNTRQHVYFLPSGVSLTWYSKLMTLSRTDLESQCLAYGSRPAPEDCVCLRRADCGEIVSYMSACVRPRWTFWVEINKTSWTGLQEMAAKTTINLVSSFPCTHVFGRATILEWTESGIQDALRKATPLFVEIVGLIATPSGICVNGSEIDFGAIAARLYPGQTFAQISNDIRGNIGAFLRRLDLLGQSLGGDLWKQRLARDAAGVITNVEACLAAFGYRGRRKKGAWAPLLRPVKPSRLAELGVPLAPKACFNDRGGPTTFDAYLYDLNACRGKADILEPATFSRKLKVNPYVDPMFGDLIGENFTAGVDGVVFASKEITLASLARYIGSRDMEALDIGTCKEIAKALVSSHPDMYENARLADPARLFNHALKHKKFSAGVPFEQAGIRTRSQLRRAGWREPLCAMAKLPYITGEWLPSIAHCVPKSQVVPKEKLIKYPEKLRTIVATSLVNNMQQGILHFDINNRHKYSSSSKVGMPMNGTCMSKVFDSASKYQNVASLDISAYDGNIDDGLLRVLAEIRKLGYKNHPMGEAIASHIDAAMEQTKNSYIFNLTTPDKEAHRKLLNGSSRLVFDSITKESWDRIEKLASSCSIEGDDKGWPNVVHKEHGGATGDSNTTWTNTTGLQVIIMHCFCKAANISYAEYFNTTYLANVGDDNIFAWDGKVSCSKLVELAKSEFGVTLTVEGTDEGIMGQTFLGKSIRPAKDFQADFDIVAHDSPRFAVLHDPDKLRMRIANLRATDSRNVQGPSHNKSIYYIRRCIGHMQLCAHQKDLYDILYKIASEEKGKLPPRFQKDKSLALPSYKRVLELWYAPLASEEFGALSKLHFTTSAYHKCESFLLKMLDGLDTFAAQLPDAAKLQPLTDDRPYTLAVEPNGIVESHAWFSLVAKLGRKPSVGEVTDRCQHSPYAAMANPKVWMEKVGDFLPTEGPLFDYLRAATEWQLLTATFVFLKTSLIFDFIGKLPLGNVFLGLWNFGTFGLPKLFGSLSTVHYMVDGVAPPALSSLVPKDLYYYHKRVSLSVATLLPLPSVVRYFAPLSFFKPVLRLGDWAFKLVCVTPFKAPFTVAPVLSGNETPWEEAAYFAVQSVEDDEKSIVVSAPTGTGKTKYLPGLCKRLTRKKHVLVVMPRNILCGEYVNMSGALWKKAGVAKNAELMVCTYGYLSTLTANSTPEWVSDSFILYDEAHEQSPEWVALVETRLALTPGVLLTATPAKWMENYKHHRVEVDPPHKIICSHHTHHGDLGEVVAREFQRSKRGLAIIPSTKAGKRMTERLKASGLRVKHVCASDREIPSDQSVHIVATAIVDAGITIPGCDLVIDEGIEYVNDRGVTKVVALSQNTKLQRAGRTGRTCPGRYMCFQNVRSEEYVPGASVLNAVCEDYIAVHFGVKYELLRTTILAEELKVEGDNFARHTRAPLRQHRKGVALLHYCKLSKRTKDAAENYYTQIIGGAAGVETDHVHKLLGMSSEDYIPLTMAKIAYEQSQPHYVDHHNTKFGWPKILNGTLVGG